MCYKCKWAQHSLIMHDTHFPKFAYEYIHTGVRNVDRPSDRRNDEYRLRRNKPRMIFKTISNSHSTQLAVFLFKGYMFRSRAHYKAGEECNIGNIILHVGPHSFSIVFDNTYGLWQLNSQKGNGLLIHFTVIFFFTVVPCGILILSKFIYSSTDAQ
jgi:hypothetical protein